MTATPDGVGTSAPSTVVAFSYNTYMATATTHCAACAAPSPATFDGYTACCDKTVCHDGPTSRYGNADVEVWACCVGQAWQRFDAAGVDPGSFSLLAESAPTRKVLI